MANPPRLQSMLSQPVMSNNFVAMQSALLTIGTGAVSTSITFTTIPSTQRISYKFSNTGSNTTYICGSNSANIIAAVASSSTPKPTSTLLSTSVCDAIPSGAIMVLDFVGGVNTISAICASGQSASLEISIGAGA